jgi:hypothetical protein
VALVAFTKEISAIALVWLKARHCRLTSQTRPERGRNCNLRSSPSTRGFRAVAQSFGSGATGSESGLNQTGWNRLGRFWGNTRKKGTLRLDPTRCSLQGLSNESRIESGKSSGRSSMRSMTNANFSCKSGEGGVGKRSLSQTLGNPAFDGMTWRFVLCFLN